MQLQKSLTNKAPQSHSKLHPHVINNIQSKLSVGDTKRDVEKPPNELPKLNPGQRIPS